MRKAGKETELALIIGAEEMDQESKLDVGDSKSLREMLLISGYSEKAIQYFFEKPHMGSLTDADQVTQITGSCGDTMKVFLKISPDQLIEDAKIQVLGCPGAVASAMAALDLIIGRPFEAVDALNDRDVFRVLENLPDQKQHCIRLSVKTIKQALEDYREKTSRGLNRSQDHAPL